MPGLFADEDLFAMAEAQIAELGETAFFAPLNQGTARPAGWGDVAVTWDRARFAEAAGSSDPRRREELFTALVRFRYAGWERRSRGWVDFDGGLATMSRHAAELGYDGIVLFLDELILWMTGHAADAPWLHGEIHKMVKLVEAGDMQRPSPFIAFIARQRNLASIVGEEFAGIEAARLEGSLEHWEGRFGTIELEDKNLPAIVERRVLRKKPGAEKTLNEAFERMKRTAGPAWQTLLGHEDAAAFRKLYPFSPALVEVLVTLSNSLQRQRTAIKLLMEMLVEHIDDLPLGEVVRLGDLFDLLAASEASADGIMKARFESARQIYRHQLLPLLREQNGTGSAARCQRMRDEHPTRLGCAGCGERACRTDNRLIKTLLVAALVPEVDAVKSMSAARLVQLNHGSLKVPIAGTETSIVAQKLRGWAAQIGQLQVGSEPDPSVRLRLEGVDVSPVLDRHRHFDTDGNRQLVIRELLFEALGLEKVLDRGKDHKVVWRGTDRTGHVYFGNDRTMGPEQLRCSDEHAFRLVIDYPFDGPEYGPSHDLEVIERYTETSGGSWTLVWLPSFFAPAIEKMLGELVILHHVLKDKETARACVSELSIENQSRALVDLGNLYSMKRARMLGVLEEAYGVAREKEGDLDSARSVESHLHLIKPGARLEAAPPPNLGEAVDVYVKGLLSARWPRHPHFTHRIDGKAGERLLGRVLERFGDLVDSPERKLPAERALIEEMRGTLGELGLVRVTENAVFLVEDRALQELEKQRQKAAVDPPSVGEVARWLDESGKMGLTDEAIGLAVRAYTRWSARALVQGGRPFVPQPGRPLPADVVLEKPELPAQAEWQAAIELAGHLFGVGLPGKALHADNLKRFEAALAARLGDVSGDATLLPGLLSRWAELAGVAGDADRLRTARSGERLVAGLVGRSVVAQVAALAAFAPETSARALGTSLASARAIGDKLGDVLTFGVFQQLAARAADLPAAAAVVAELAASLRQDEVIEALVGRIALLAIKGLSLLPPDSGHAAPPDPRTRQLSVHATGKRAVLAELDRVVREARTMLETSGDRVELNGRITLRLESR
ncbi:MAG TPA: hypothetical protein VK824_09760 [Planctomycetota bacterium]|nr:hypothetical protein [Planctomycetota bacterium]